METTEKNTGAVIWAVQGDITRLDVDVIVNAANPGLLGGGGVDGAIHRAAGPTLLEECRRIPSGPEGRCPTGEARITGAGNLPCKRVIHTVGPVWSGGGNGEEALLSRCYRNALLLAEAERLPRAAFPCISTGVYGYPRERAAQTAVNTVRAVLQECRSIKEVIFCCFDHESYALYLRLM